MVYDFHAHIYPDKIAEKAVQGVSDFYTIHVDEIGTVSRLLELGDEAGIDRFIVHSVATTAGQVPKINDFVASEVAKHPDRLVGFAAMHPEFEEKIPELERACAAGIKGVKLHPDCQSFYVDDPRMFEFYDYLQSKKIPMLVHCGDYRYDYDNPNRVRKVLDNFPDLVFIGAHFGAWSLFDLAVEYLKDTKCYFDCSSSLPFIGKKRSAELIKLYGAERMLFGSDFPMWNPGAELETLRSLDISHEEIELMTTINPRKILGE